MIGHDAAGVVGQIPARSVAVPEHVPPGFIGADCVVGQQTGVHVIDEGRLLRLAQARGRLGRHENQAVRPPGLVI